MAVNTQVTSRLVAQNVPPDEECNIKTLSEILAGIALFMSIETDQGEDIASTSDSIAQQALEIANTALATAQEAAGKIPEKRAFGDPMDVPTGDSNWPFTWTPAMPDTNYEVRGCFFGPVTETTVGGWIVVDGSKTVNGVTIRLINVPANQKFSAVVEQLPSI